MFYKRCLTEDRVKCCCLEVLQYITTVSPNFTTTNITDIHGETEK